MGMILRIASSRIVGQGDIVGRSGYFSLNLSANSVMRGRLDARRTLKSLVADLRLISGAVELSASMGFVEAIESKQRGGSRKIKTIDHPMVRAIEYEDNPAPAMRRLVQSIANDDNITPE